MSGETVLCMKKIGKIFPGVRALRSVDFDLRRGEVHGLVGENGAGKSTLMKVLGGVYQPEEGSIEIDGRPAQIRGPGDSIRAGVSVIYQEFNLVPTLSVAENIFLGKEIASRRVRVLDRKKMEAKALECVARLGLAADCSEPVSSLSIARQQVVEIAKALFNDSKILVMDEPTAVLSQKESAALFDLIGSLRKDGISIIFISHRLEEVIALCDRITVLRDGEVVDTIDQSGGRASKDELIRSMVGRVLNDYFPEPAHAVGRQKLLEVQGLAKEGLFDDVSFDLHPGEILGFYGLIGAGRTEIMKTLSGAYRADRGKIFVRGRGLSTGTIQGSREAGIVLVPEDRKAEGLVIGMTLAQNVGLPNLRSLSRAGVVSRRKVRTLVEDCARSLSIRPPAPDKRMIDFSGGNQQKAVIAKWLAGSPDIIIFDEPTRGIDVGSKTEIYHLIEKLASKGVGVIIVSSELLEILGMCDRIIVIHEGRVTGRFDRSEASQELVVRAAVGA